MPTTLEQLRDQTSTLLARLGPRVGFFARSTNPTVEESEAGAVLLLLAGAVATMRQRVGNDWVDLVINAGRLSGLEASAFAQLASSPIFTGGTVTAGDGSGAAQFNLNALAGQSTALVFRRNGVIRATIELEPTGSRLTVNNFDASGAFTGVSIDLDPTTGAVRMPSQPTLVLEGTANGGAGFTVTAGDYVTRSGFMFPVAGQSTSNLTYSAGNGGITAQVAGWYDVTMTIWAFIDAVNPTCAVRITKNGAGTYQQLFFTQTPGPQSATAKIYLAVGDYLLFQEASNDADGSRFQFTSPDAMRLVCRFLG
ncbi:MAG: hypothetical protein AAF737_04710 [Pseudomonadota bacterium]